MARATKPLVDISGLDDLRARYAVLGRYAFADALQDAVNALADLAQMRMAETFRRDIEGGPARFTEIRPGSRASSVLTRKAKGATKGIASASIEVQDKQAEYLAFMLGEQAIREPGQVGVATNANFVPVPENLRLVGVKVTPQGGLERNGLKKLVGLTRRGRLGHGLRKSRKTALHDADVDRALAGTDRTAETVFYGTPRGKRRTEGFWLRPAERKGRLALLAAALPRSVYDEAYLVPAWNEAVVGAGRDAQAIVRETLEARLDAIYAGRQAKVDRKNAKAREERLAARMRLEAQGLRVHPGQLHSSARRRAST